MIEFGSNIGLNSLALKLPYPAQTQSAIEINERAAERLSELMPNMRVFNTAISNFEPSATAFGSCDLALVKGVIIHMKPDQINMV